MTETRNLHVGGVVAMGFSADGAHLLVCSHSGRGVYCTRTWERVARNIDVVYPIDGVAIGIGPIIGERVAVKESYESGVLAVRSEDGTILLEYEEGTITVTRKSCSGVEERQV